MSTATLELNEEQWRIITRALKNSGNLDWQDFGNEILELVTAQIGEK
jgi:hypothetical protein